jgi:hypothetical protein
MFIYGITPRQLVELIEEIGLPYDLGTLPTNHLHIRAALDEQTEFNIQFHPGVPASEEGLDTPAPMVQFATPFEAIGPATLSRLNTWNAQTLFGKAYIDGTGLVSIEHCFMIKGCAPPYVRGMIEIWDDVLSQFASHLYSGS